MTDNNIEHSGAQEERDEQSAALDSMPIAQLRQFAKFMKIPSQRDWSKEDYVDAIKRRQEQTSSPNFVFDSESAPKPGYARLLIHRDPTPGHKNSPIHLGFNGTLISVPRGVEVDVPYPFVEILKNARSTVIEDSSQDTSSMPGPNNKSSYRDSERASYPYQVSAITPGEYINPNDSRGRSYAERLAFFNKFGSWPTEGELKEAKKLRMVDMFK